jgi:hypothetical protein
VIRELWTQELTIDYQQKLSVSMLRRMQMVIEAKGEAIK